MALLRHAAQSGPLDDEALARMAERALGLTDGDQCCVCACDYDSDGFVCWDCAGDAADKDLRQRLADTEALAEARRDGLREALGAWSPTSLSWDTHGCEHCNGPITPKRDPVRHTQDCRYVALRKLAGLETDARQDEDEGQDELEDELARGGVGVR